MSTTGRRPVMAAPTPIPVKPASEIGVSSTRSRPNSSTRPDRTLKGVPASATSSPKMHTRSSRRISSARASRTAWANVSSRSGIHVLGYLSRARIARFHRELYRRFHLFARLGCNTLKHAGIGVMLIHQPLAMKLDGIALVLPVLLLLLGAVVLAIDVAYVMPAVTVGIRLQERRTFTTTRSLHQSYRHFIHRTHVLTIHSCGFDPESRRAAENRSCRGLGVVRVFVIEIVFANINNRQLPELRQIHHFVQRSLAQRAFSEEAHRHAAISQLFHCQSRSGGDPYTAAHNCIRP